MALRLEVGVVGNQVSQTGGVELMGQAFDDCVVWVNHPGSGFGVANGTVVLEEQVHCMFFASAGEFGALAPGKEVDND